MPTLFEVSHIYRVNPTDRSLEVSDSELTLVDTDTLYTDLVSSGIRVQGLQQRDLAVFSTIIDETGGGQCGFLVTNVSQTHSELATPEAIEREKTLLTPELSKKIALLAIDELTQLGVPDSLISIARTRYPESHGLS